jgi:hypothetical protein
VQYPPKNPSFKLDSQEMLQIRDKSFIFLLLVRSIVNPRASALAPHVSTPNTIVATVVSQKGSRRPRGVRNEDGINQRTSPQQGKGWKGRGRCLMFGPHMKWSPTTHCQWVCLLSKGLLINLSKSNHDQITLKENFDDVGAFQRFCH